MADRDFIVGLSAFRFGKARISGRHRPAQSGPAPIEWTSLNVSALGIIYQSHN